MQLLFDNSQRSLRTRDGNKYNSLFPAGGDSTVWSFDSGGVNPLHSSDDSSVFLQPLPAKEEVLRFLLQSDENDALWVLDGVLSDRPELLQQQLERVRPRKSALYEERPSILEGISATAGPRKSAHFALRPSFCIEVDEADDSATDTRKSAQERSSTLEPASARDSWQSAQSVSRPSRFSEAACDSWTTTRGTVIDRDLRNSSSDVLKSRDTLMRKSTRNTRSLEAHLAEIRQHSSSTQERAEEIRKARKSGAQEELQRRRVFVSDPLIQFSSFIYYYSEDDCRTQLEVVRIGNTHIRSEVHYETVDATGMAELLLFAYCCRRTSSTAWRLTSYKSFSVPSEASHKYKHKKGILVFHPGEQKKLISVELVDDDMWGTTTEFHVTLKNQGIVGAVLGKYLWQARVIITDDDTFPTNRFKEQILSNRTEEIPKVSLLIEYCKMNFRSKPGIRHGTLKMLLVEQVHNLMLALRLLLNIYLVDFVLKKTVTKDKFMFVADRMIWLAGISLSFLVETCMLHLVDYTKLGWGVAGLSRHTLQAALLTKFLNYDETSRTQFRCGDLVLAVTRDTERLVAMGYMGFIALSQNFGQFMIMLSMRCLLSAILEHKNISGKLGSLSMVFLVPMLKVPFLAWRKKLNTTVLDDQHRKQNDLAHHIEQTVANYRLIADFNRRPYFVDKFNTRIRDYNLSTLQALTARQNNHYFGMWLTALIVGLYTLMGGMNVLQDTLTLGTFLADIHIFHQIGHAWSKIFHIFLDMQLVMPDLVRMVSFMNLPIDVPHKMSLHRCNEDLGKQYLAEIQKTSEGDLVHHDCLPIIVENIEFKFNTKMVKDVRATTLGNMRGELHVQQGQMASLVGPRGEGKSTLLKIIGGVNLAMAHEFGTTFFIPPHLRVLHVSTEPMFFHGTLLENVIFGVAPGDPDGKIERVLAICERVGLPEFIKDFMLTEETHEWEDLSQTQKHLLNISRALIANPELMCIHKPVQVFDKVHSMKILILLKEFVLNKGIEQGTMEDHYRRPRTCISTSSTMQGVELADVVYHVSHAQGIQEMVRDHVTSTMLG